MTEAVGTAGEPERDRLSVAFFQGIQDYRDFRPRPPRPADDDHAWDETDCLYAGWMMGRVADVQKIHDEINSFMPDGDDAAAERRIRRLDMDHGLSPFRDMPW